MNIKKITLLLLILTVVSFSLSYVASRLGNKTGDSTFPFGLIQKYGQQFQGKEGRIHREIDAPAVEEVRIETSSTEIEISPSEDTAVRVDLEGIFVSGTEELDDALKTNLDGKTLVLGIDEDLARKASSKLRFEFGPKRLVVKVPATVKRISLQSSSASLEIREMILLSVQAQTSSGDVSLREVTVQSSKLRTSSGGINVQGTFEKIEASTESGDLNADFVNASPEAELHTSSGNLRLNFRILPDVDLQVQARSGDIQIEDELKARTTQKRGGAVKTVRATTSSGDISLTHVSQ